MQIVICNVKLLSCDRPKKISLRILKRRLCKVPSRAVSIDERLTGLTEKLTVIEDGDARSTGEQREQHLNNHSGLCLLFVTKAVHPDFVTHY